MNAVHAIVGVGRGLLRIIMVYAAVVSVAIAVMVGFAAQSALIAVVILTPLLMVTALVFGPRLARWRLASQRRKLRRAVGDPLNLAGEWRRLLGDAWAARDEFATAVAGYAGSPIGERLAGHQMVVDATLVHCGELARSGHRLHMQLKSFRPRRLRRDLLLERRRDRDGHRAAALTRQLDDVEHLRAELDGVRVQLETQVHDLRTATWRAATLRSGAAGAPDVALDELLEDLGHLEAALAEVSEPDPTTERGTAAGDATTDQGTAVAHSTSEHDPAPEHGRARRATAP